MALIYARFPGGLSRALTMSYDHGVETDRRLIGIMQNHGLKGTFNINAGCFAPEGTVYPAGTVHRRMSESDCLALYRDSGMEVALHGYRHAWLTYLPKTVFSLVKVTVIVSRFTIQKRLTDARDCSIFAASARRRIRRPRPRTTSRLPALACVSVTE